MDLSIHADMSSALLVVVAALILISIVENIVICVPGLSLSTFISLKGLNGPIYVAVDSAQTWSRSAGLCYGWAPSLVYDHFDALLLKGSKEKEEFDLYMQAIVEELLKLTIV